MSYSAFCAADFGVRQRFQNMKKKPKRENGGKMKKILNIILFIILLVFFYSGCDSGKKGLQEKKTETTQKSEPVQLQKTESKPFKKTEKVLYTLVCAKDGINIRTGPGTNYSKDETGQTMKGEKFYVLEEKNGWIRFRVTPTDVGWSGWVLKRLVEEKQQKKTSTYTKKRNNDLQVLYDSGLLKKFNIDYNEAWVNSSIWNALDYDTKVGIGIKLAKICDQAGSTGRITFYDNRTGKKLARYSQSWGYKSY